MITLDWKIKVIEGLTVNVRLSNITGGLGKIPGLL